MKSILHTLFNKGIIPGENIKTQDPEYKIVNQKICDKKEILKKNISVEDYKLFEEIENLYGDSDSIYSEEVFSYGFRLGVLIMIEVLANSEE